MCACVRAARPCKEPDFPDWNGELEQPTVNEIAIRLFRFAAPASQHEYWPEPNDGWIHSYHVTICWVYGNT